MPTDVCSNAYRMNTDLANVAAKIQAAIGKVEDFGQGADPVQAA